MACDYGLREQQTWLQLVGLDWTDAGDWDLEYPVKGFDQALGFILLALSFTCVENFSPFLFLHFEMAALGLIDLTL